MVDNILILILIMIDELTKWNIKRNKRYTHCVAKNTVYYYVQIGIIVTGNSGRGGGGVGEQRRRRRRRGRRGDGMEYSFYYDFIHIIILSKEQGDILSTTTSL